MQEAQTDTVLVICDLQNSPAAQRKLLTCVSDTLAKLVFFSQVPLKRHRRVNVSEMAGNDAEAEEASGQKRCSAP